MTSRIGCGRSPLGCGRSPDRATRTRIPRSTSHLASSGSSPHSTISVSSEGMAAASSTWNTVSPPVGAPAALDGCQESVCAGGAVDRDVLGEEGNGKRRLLVLVLRVSRRTGLQARLFLILAGRAWRPDLRLRRWPAPSRPRRGRRSVACWGRRLAVARGTCPVAARLRWPGRPPVSRGRRGTRAAAQ